MKSFLPERQQNKEYCWEHFEEDSSLWLIAEALWPPGACKDLKRVQSNLSGGGFALRDV